MDPSQVALLADARLSDAARVLGLHLSTLGEGDHEMKFDTLATLLHGCPNNDTVGRHMRQLVVFGYAERVSAGGIGSPRYRWAGREITRAEPTLPVKERGQEPTVVGVGDEGIPPVVPQAERRLTERAMKAMERAGDKLAGCRGALRDYLTDRVPEDRQYAYVQSVVGWLDGLGRAFTQHDGTQAPAERRPGILADALNDLAGSDETKLSRPVGDVGNLRTKIDVLLRSEGPRPPRKSRAVKNATAGPQQFDYTPTTEFKGFTR